mmetsp:Transcript_2635/g.6636  ORF Transcript_2635/g.6636 Transcript_2635/m.6636 type:complete len:203 (-) Transcript_2635:947-1555(-)
MMSGFTPSLVTLNFPKKSVPRDGKSSMLTPRLAARCVYTWFCAASPSSSASGITINVAPRAANIKFASAAPCGATTRRAARKRRPCSFTVSSPGSTVRTVGASEPNTRLTARFISSSRYFPPTMPLTPSGSFLITSRISAASTSSSSSSSVSSSSSSIAISSSASASRPSARSLATIASALRLALVYEEFGFILSIILSSSA